MAHHNESAWGGLTYNQRMKMETGGFGVARQLIERHKANKLAEKKEAAKKAREGKTNGN